MSLDHSWFFLAFLARDGKNVTIVTFHTPPTHGLVGRLALSNLTLNMVSHKQQNSTNPGLVGCLALSNLTLNMVSHKQQNSTNPGLVGCLA
jgi:hypothetical protein